MHAGIRCRAKTTNLPRKRKSGSGSDSTCKIAVRAFFFVQNNAGDPALVKRQEYEIEHPFRFKGGQPFMSLTGNIQPSEPDWKSSIQEIGYCLMHQKMRELENYPLVPLVLNKPNDAFLTALL